MSEPSENEIERVPVMAETSDAKAPPDFNKPSSVSLIKHTPLQLWYACAGYAQFSLRWSDGLTTQHRIGQFNRRVRFRSTSVQTLRMVPFNPYLGQEALHLADHWFEQPESYYRVHWLRNLDPTRYMIAIPMQEMASGGIGYQVLGLPPSAQVPFMVENPEAPNNAFRGFHSVRLDEDEVPFQPYQPE